MPSYRSRLVFFVVLLPFCASLSAVDPDTATQLPRGLDTISFNRDIRPILSDHCFACHGPDAKHREADLRVDTEDGLLGKDGSQGVVLPNRLNDSELWKRISSHDADEQMPPVDFAKPLDDTQRALIRRWIEQGANWEGHWSFQPLARPLPPKVDAPIVTTFARNEIDTFALRTMLEHQLQPSGSAEPRILVRRLSFDLLGLPPSMEQVRQFEHDSSPQAYKRLVNDMLASPHFGERMAMWWLDLVRYADSVGYHGDQPMSVSPFRDYVINAFNTNKPFDQFTREQLAGDLLPEATLEQKIASGYNRLGMMSAEGGVQPKEYLAKYIAERVRNLGGTWLGVTLGCCECHDHKYDPFSTREFYQFEAFFADIQEQGLYSGNKWGNELPVPTSEQALRKSALESQIANVKQRLEQPTDAIATAQREWEAKQISWQILKPASAKSQAGAKLSVQEDGSVLASGKNPDTDSYTLTFDNLPEKITALQIEVLPHDSLPNKGPGRAGNGNFVLSELRAATQKAIETKESSKTKFGAEEEVAISSAVASYEQVGAAANHPYGKWAVAAAIDKDVKGKTWGWAIMEQAGQPNSAVFEFATSINGISQRLVLRLDQNLDNPQHNLGHFRISVTSETPPVAAQAALPSAIATILRVKSEERSPEQIENLAKHYRTITPLLAEERKQLASLEKELEQLNNSITTTLVTATVQPRMIRVLNRGNWMDENGVEVQPAFPQVLGGSPTTDRRLTRLDLADWVVSTDNPLTARVFVNRVWKMFFGNGLSARVDDLGSQGQWPSDPELLDWLATRFIESGWNVKELIKLIVMSATYQQSSLVSTQVAEVDPFNRWLSHQSRYRLDAEMVRDNLLAVSGLLVDEIGGTSVKPYQPRGYWAYLNFPQREWDNGKGEQLYRRGLYTHWQRQYLHPSLLAFDAPSREECTADRARSNTPLQALVLLNDPSFVEAARVLATKVVALGKGDTQRIEWLFEQTLNRKPKELEVTVLTELLERHRQQYQQDVEAAKALNTVGEKSLETEVDRPELAAWISVTRTLLNLHELITRN